MEFHADVIKSRKDYLKGKYAKKNGESSKMFPFFNFPELQFPAYCQIGPNLFFHPFLVPEKSTQ
jgi:hypothetical protein